MSLIWELVVLAEILGFKMNTFRAGISFALAVLL